MVGVGSTSGWVSMVSKAALVELKDTYRKWNETKAGNVEQFLALLSDDFTMGSLSAGAAGMEFSRDHLNRDQARNYFAEMLKDWTLLFFHIRGYIAQASEVAVICECCWRHNRTHRVVHSPKLDLWKFKGRKAVGFFEFFDTDQAIGACAEGPLSDQARKPLYSANEPTEHTALTATARSNLRKIRNMYARYNASRGANRKEILKLLAPNVDWLSLANGAGGIPFTVKRSTIAEVEGFFNELYRDWDMNKVEMDGYIAGGPFIVAHGAIEFTNKRTGKRFRSPKADVWRFDHGKVAEFMEYYDTAGAMRAAA
jgi:ketosteroid isomerase-like protein